MACLRRNVKALDKPCCQGLYDTFFEGEGARDFEKQASRHEDHSKDVNTYILYRSSMGNNLTGGSCPRG